MKKRMVATVLAVAALSCFGHSMGDEVEAVRMENDSIRVVLDGETGAFVSVFNKLSGLELVSEGQAGALPWEMSLGIAGEGERQISEAESFSISEAEYYGEGEAYELRWEVKEGMTVAVRAELAAGGEPLRLYPAVLSGATDSMVIKLRYPVVRGIGRLVERGEENFLAHPLASGFLFKDPYSLFQGRAGRGLVNSMYPNGFDAPTQFMVYYADKVGGFYFGCEDPYNTVKDIDFYAPAQKEYLEAAFGHYSWDMHFGNSLRLGYPVVLGALGEGNWYEGAELYREWAMGEGPGHPDWCKKGRLEDRVAQGEASKWLSEEVGFSTFGMPSSIDVSKWIEAFHEAADGPVFHVFGHDWPKWAGNPMEQGEMRKAALALGLGPFNNVPTAAYERALDVARGFSGDAAVKEFVKSLYAQRGMEPREDYPFEQARILFAEAPKFVDRTRVRTGQPKEWFPSIMDQGNIETLKRLGDRYALFQFDFFSYGFDLEKYGLNTWKEGPLAFNPRKGGGFAANWMDPGTRLWQEFHAERDARATEEVGADADYYDISSAAVARSLFSNRSDRLERPMGWGRKLVEEYRSLYEKTKMATREASGGKYVPQGSEVMAEVYMAEMDYAQCRAGGGVQSDMEGIRFLDWMKEGKAWRIPLFTYVYHEYGGVKLDGWAKLSREFGDIFYYIASQVALEGGILELNYEFSPLELFAGMTPPSYQLRYHLWIEADDTPLGADPGKVKFLREITRARTGFAKDFLAYGEMTRPATLVGPTQTAELDWIHYNSIKGRRDKGVFTAPSVVHYGWRYKEERLGYVFCNVLAESQMVDVLIDLEGTVLEGQRVKVFEVVSGKTTLLGNIDGGRRAFSLSLPPRKVILLLVRPTRWGS
jgi:hypothetical protein